MIMKRVDEADKLIGDIDRMGERAGETISKYKKVLTDIVKKRLLLMKEFFNDYNKVCKNVYGMALDCGDGIVAYTVTCLKYFG